MKGLNNDITFSDAGEIFHMSGPWMGNLHWKNLHKIDSIMMDTIFTERNSKRIYFIRCHMPTKWRKDVYFSLCFIQIESEQVYEVEQRLPSTSLPEITTDRSNNDIVLVQFPKKDFVIDINDCSLITLSNETIRNQ